MLVDPRKASESVLMEDDVPFEVDRVKSVRNHTKVIFFMEGLCPSHTYICIYIMYICFVNKQSVNVSTMRCLRFLRHLSNHSFAEQVIGE